MTLALSGRDLAFYDVAHGCWILEDGEIEVEVGASSRDIRGRVTVVVTGDAPDLALSAQSTLGEWLADPRGEALLAPRLASAASSGLSSRMLKMLGSIPMSRLARFPKSPITPEELAALVAAVRDPDRPT